MNYVEIQFVLCLLIAFTLKFLLIIEVADIIKKWEQGSWIRIAEAWIIVQTYLFGAMIFLSCFHFMTRFSLYIFLIVPNIGYIVSKFLKKEKVNLPRIRVTLSGLGVLLVVLYVICHSFFFMDSTWDSHTYEMTRILLFSEKKSLLINMDTAIINIFTNEWNGELNAIFYRILSGNNQGISFGNAENLLYGSMCIMCFAEQMKLSVRNKNIITLFIITQPIVIALSMTIKGDFLVIFLMIISYVLWDNFMKNKNNFHLTILLITLGMMAGTKISMVPFAGIGGIIIAIYTLKNYKSFLKGYIISFLGILICCSRYVLNFIFYGNPFMRVDSYVEKIEPSSGHFLNNIYQIINSVLSIDSLFTKSQPKGSVLNLGIGIGGLSVFILFTFGLIILIAKKKLTIFGKTKNFFLIPFIGSIIIFALSTNWYDFSFRYYLPWICTIEILLITTNIRYIKKNANRRLIEFVLIFITLISALDSYKVIEQYTEINPWSFSVASKKSLVEREYAAHIDFLYSEQKPSISDYWTAICKDRNVLVCHYPDQITSYLFGDNMSNSVDFCNIDQIIEMIKNHKYDVVSVACLYNRDDIDEYLLSQNYVCYEPELYYFDPEYYAVKVYIKKNIIQDNMNQSGQKKALLNNKIST